MTALPTAVLSTHTGGFTGYTFRDLTEDLPKIAAHWKTLPIRFDVIYTGYLGSGRQLELVSELIDIFRSESTLDAVDPVMADAGKLYECFSPDFPKGMAALCAKADLILPNLTEAALLLGEDYRPGPYTRGETGALLRRLSALGPGKTVLTGVQDGPERIGCAVYDAAADRADYVMTEKIPGFYHGAGDVFASALIGVMTRGFPLPQAARAAADFTEGSIRRTRAAGTDTRLGLDFEEGLPEYIRALENGMTGDARP